MKIRKIALAALGTFTIAVVSSASTLWSSGEYLYDGAGNITAIGTAAVPNSYNRQSTYTYDLSGRLTAAIVGHSSGSLAETYEYDGFGNLKKRTIGGQPDVVPDPDPATNRNREGVTVYDVAGNMTRRADNDDASYDAFNQMSNSTSASGSTQAYIYTASDERIAVDTGAAVHWTIRDLDNKPIRQFDSGPLTSSQWSSTDWTWGEDYVWGSGKLLASQRSAAMGGRRHFHLDHLGSTRVATDSGGTQLFIRDFAPFGSEITPIHSDERVAFTGHERDYDYSQFPNANALDYMHARYYDSRIGRFLSTDPAVVFTALPQDWNRYTYARNSPLKGVDHDGRRMAYAYGVKVDVEPGYLLVLARKDDHAQRNHVAIVSGFVKRPDGTLSVQVAEFAPQDHIKIGNRESLVDKSFHKIAISDTNSSSAGAGIWNKDKDDLVGVVENKGHTSAQVLAAVDFVNGASGLRYDNLEMGMRNHVTDCAGAVDQILDRMSELFGGLAGGGWMSLNKGYTFEDYYDMRIEATHIKK